MQISYLSAGNVESHRRVRLRGVVFERSVAFIDCHDLDKDEPRRLRLDRITRARPIETN